MDNFLWWHYLIDNLFLRGVLVGEIPLCGRLRFVLVCILGRIVQDVKVSDSSAVSLSSKLLLVPQWSRLLRLRELVRFLEPL